MDIFLLYLFTRLDALQDGFVVASLLSMGAIAVFMALEDFTYGEERERQKALFPRRVCRCVVAAVCFAILAVLTPSQKDAAIILAGYGVLEVAKSETAGRIASKSVQLIEQTLDSYLKQKDAKK